MSVNDRDVSALEHLAFRIREDAHGVKPWDAEGTHIVFDRELKGMHLITAIEQVLHHAADPEAKTPAAIKRPFKPELPKPDGHQTPPRRAEECDLHPGQRAANCGGCAADRLAGEITHRQPARPAPMPAEYVAAKAALGRGETEEEA